MLQRRGELDLLQEPLAADHRAELRVQHLDRHLAPVLQVLGEVDGGHAALAELALEAIALGEGGGEAVEIGHLAWDSSLSTRTVTSLCE